MRHALRSLLRAPALFITAVTLLALGIGATTAVFSVVNGVLLAPLPYENPDRLVRMWTELSARNVAHFPESPVNLEDFRQQATLFETIGGVNTGNNATFTGPSGEPQQVSGGGITWDFLSMLGVEPTLGRNFSAEDAAFSATDVPAGAEFPATAFANPRAALISHRLWQREFGGDRAAVGAIVTLNDFDVEVIGVLPRGFRLYMAPRTNVTPDVDVWTPLRVDFASAPRNNVFLNMVGRVRDGVPIEQAIAQIEQLGARIYDDNGVMRAAGARKHAMPYGDELVSDVRGSIWALLGAAVFVLLIASANVANLLLVRSAGRTRELAIRTALGARRRQIISPLLAESAVLALFGALGGLVLAHAGIVLIVDSAPANVPRLDAVQIEWRVLLFTAAVALATTLLAGAAPAIQGSRLLAPSALRDRSTSNLGTGNRTRTVLVTAEIALSFVLLIGAALMVRSFVELHRTDLGFDPRHVMTFEVNLGQRYPDAGRREQFYYEFQQRLESLPGVVRAAATTPLPLSGQQFHGRYATHQPTGDDTPYRQANYRTVLPGYFETMRTPLLAGRHLTRADETDERRVVVVDSRLAQISWPHEDPIGQQVWLRLNDPEPVAFEVVGVVHRQLQDGIEADGRETVYFTARSAGQFGINGWVVRTSVPPESILPLVRGELAAMDPALPLMQVRSMNDLVDAALARTRFSLQLMTAFGVAALLIAAVGLYAAIQYIVRQRRAEIGVRISFGARPRNIFRLFVQHGLTLATAGILIGVVAAIALAQTISSMIVDVATTDPVTYAVVAAFLLAIALVASALPALRAAHLDPMIVLREE